jgi:phage shock protein A
MNGITIDDFAFSKFDRVAMKVEESEAEADALLELTACCDPVDEIDPVREDVETELAALKHSMATAGC